MDKHPGDVIDKLGIVSMCILNLPQALFVRNLVDFYRGNLSQYVPFVHKLDMGTQEVHDSQNSSHRKISI